MHKLIIFLATVGLSVTLHLWIQKARGFEDQCWGAVGSAAADTNCNSPEITRASSVFGISTAALGYTFFLATIILAASKLLLSSKVGSLCQRISEGLTVSASCFAIYLIYVQVRAGTYCVWCLCASALILTILGLSLRSHTESVRKEEEIRRDVAQIAIIGFAGNAVLVGVLVFVNEVGTRRLDHGQEAKQIEKVLADVLPKYLAKQGATNVKQPYLETSDWINESTPMLGTAGSVPVVLFLDPNCPHCKDSYVSFRKLAQENQGIARFYLLPRPLWSYSVEQVQALEVAKLDGKYWEMWDLQFQRQKKGGMTTEDIRGLFRDLDLSLTHMQSRLDSVKLAVHSSRKKADAANINATPTLFVDGSQVRLGGNITYKTLGEMIREISAKKSAVEPKTVKATLK